MLTSPKNNSAFPRRVSFDLSHNTVHLLPTLEECRDAAKQRSREEWQRKSLNEEMLSEDIIIEIQEDCSACSRHTDSEEEQEGQFEPKSCLKKPPVVIATTTTSTKRSKKNQKKRKRANSNVTNVVSVH